jgi:hypothetical protein
LDKFDSKSNVDIFPSYSSSNKAYRVCNNKTLCLEESMHVTFEETQNDKIVEILDDINKNIQHLNLIEKTPMKANNKEIEKDQPSTSNQYEIVINSFVPPKELWYVSSHHSKLIIGNLFKLTKTIISIRNISEHCALVSHIEPNSFLEAERIQIGF